MSGTPALSAILNMPVDFDTIRKTVRHLLEQSARSRIELLIVTTPDKAATIPVSSLHAFGSWQIVSVPDLSLAAVGFGAGVRQAKSPVVVLCEDHSFPDSGWAEALLQAHGQECIAVGPAMANGNPDSLVSWANYLLCFVEWFQPASSGPVSSCAGHNTSYKRDALLHYDLDAWFASERVLHADFVAKGRGIYLEAQAATRHVNLSKASSYLCHSFFGGRIFGGARSAGWPLPRRCLYAVAFPLVPAIRIRRIWGVLNTPARRRAARFWPALPWTLAGLILHAFGEASGYLFGAGNSMKRYMDFEMYRARHVNAADRAILRDAAPVATESLAAR